MPDFDKYHIVGLVKISLVVGKLEKCQLLEEFVWVGQVTEKHVFKRP